MATVCSPQLRHHLSSCPIKLDSLSQREIAESLVVRLAAYSRRSNWQYFPSPDRVVAARPAAGRTVPESLLISIPDPRFAVIGNLSSQSTTGRCWWHADTRPAFDWVQPQRLIGRSGCSPVLGTGLITLSQLGSMENSPLDFPPSDISPLAATA